MARPAGGYRDALNTAVASVTEITGRFKDSGALMWWSWNQGRLGKGWREELEKAGDIGSCLHERIECDWRNKVFDASKYTPEVVAKSESPWRAYEKWQEQSRFAVIKAEQSLVSERYKFGGTFDAAFMGNDLVLGDWKTSNGIYPDQLVQVAGGYSLLWGEHFPEPLEGIVIVRFSKPKQDDDPVSFHHHYYSKEIFPLCQRQFLLWLESYHLDKRIKGLV